MQSGAWALLCGRGRAQLQDCFLARKTPVRCCEAPDRVCGKHQAQQGGYLSLQEGGQGRGLAVRPCGDQAGVCSPLGSPPF